jgi:hypothetical protein
MSKPTIQPSSNLAQSHKPKQAMAQRARPIGQRLAAHATQARPACARRLVTDARHSWCMRGGWATSDLSTLESWRKWRGNELHGKGY